MSKWWLACVALLGQLTAAPASWAAEVRWLAPPGCTDHRGTVEEAERLLGRSLGSVRSLDFDVRITDDGGRWRLKLRTVERATGERRERELSGASCDEVTAAAAVALAMVVNASEPNADQEAAEAPPAAAPMPEAATTTEPTPPVSSTSPPRVAREVRSAERAALYASVALAGDSGALPAAAPGGEVALSIDYGRFRLTGLGALLASSQRQDGKGADFQLLLGALLACGRRPLGPTIAAICVGVEAGELSGTGAGVRNPRSGRSFWWAPRVDAGLTLPFAANWALLGRLGATLPRERREFVLGDGLFIHRADRLTGRVSLGVELHLM